MNFIKKYYWLIVPIVGFLVVRFVFDFNGLYGQDSYAYLLHAREWKTFILEGNKPDAFFWPPNYSIVTALLSFVLSNDFLAAQLVSVLSFIGVGFVLDKWVKEQNQTTETVRIAFVTLGWFLSPYIFRLGMQSMSDMFAMLFLTLSFYFLWRLSERKNEGSLILFALAAATCITTRYPAVIVLLPAVGYALILALKQKKWKATLTAIIVAAIPISLAIIWKLNSGGIDSNISKVIFTEWSASNFFERVFIRPSNKTTYFLPNLLFNLSVFVHPGTLLLGFPALLFLRPFQLKGTQFTMLISVLGYAVFLSGLPFQNSRVLSFALPVVLMLLFPAVHSLFAHFANKQFKLQYILSVLFTVQIGLTARAMMPSIQYNKLEQSITNWVAKNAPNQPVYTSDFSLLFDVYETGSPVKNIFETEFKSFESESVFIYNTQLDKSKLSGTIVSENWHRANELMDVKRERCFGNNWCIFSLRNK